MRYRLSVHIRTICWLGAFLCLPCASSLGADIDLAGRDFTLAVMPGYSNHFPLLVLIAQSDTGLTQVIVEWPAGSPSMQDTVLIGPGGFPIALPGAAGDWTPGTDQNAVSVRTDRDVVCLVRNNYDTAGAAACALPHDALGTSYWITTYDGFMGFPGLDAGQFVVMGTVPGTQVTITPSQDLVTGQSANLPFQVMLDPGDAFFGRSVSTTGSAANLTGTSITATDPVAVMEGNRATQVPTGSGYVNATTEFCWPTNYWDSACVITGIPDNGPILAGYYCIQGVQSTTQLTYNPPLVGSPTTINSPGFALVGPVTTNHLVTASGPIKVTQWNSGTFDLNIRKPEAVVIPGPAQFTSTHTFVSDQLGFPEFRWATVIVDTSAMATFELDGTQVGSNAFETVGNSAFAVAHLTYVYGTHTTRSPGASHTVIIHEGVDGFNSFAYQAGVLFMKACPITMTGDVNVSGGISSADIITLVNHVFKGGAAPLPCAAGGDVNCNGAITSSDIISLVNYVFKGGDPPCDGCTSPLAIDC